MEGLIKLLNVQRRLNLANIYAWNCLLRSIRALLQWTHVLTCWILSILIIRIMGNVMTLTFLQHDDPYFRPSRASYDVLRPCGKSSTADIPIIQTLGWQISRRELRQTSIPSPWKYLATLGVEPSSWPTRWSQRPNGLMVSLPGSPATRPPNLGIRANVHIPAPSTDRRSGHMTDQVP